MSPQPSKNSQSKENVILDPNPRLPLIIILLGVLLYPLPISILPTIVISSFGLFLLIQSYTLSIEFTQKDFVVKQLGKEIRRFPFEKWISWRIFLPQLPGLLYFREEASPHLLPLIFDCKGLENQLREKVGNLEISNQNISD